MSTAKTDVLLDDHSVALTIALHLVPGALIAAAYYWIGVPVAEAIGYPAIFGFLIASLLVLLPWELGLLYYLGRKRNGAWSLEGVVRFRYRVPRGRLVGLVAGLCLWALFVAIGLSFIDRLLLETFFSWLPDRFQLTAFTPTEHPLALFHVATVLNLLLFGIGLPLVEELYFRGFLLPRMTRLERLAPVANGVLFALYHLWTPWMAVTRSLFVVPMVWFVWKKRSIEVGIWTHCALNCIGILLTYALLMSSR